MNNIRRTKGDFGKKIGNPNPLEFDAVLALKANLLQATHHMHQYCPAVKVFNPARFCRNSPPAPPPPIGFVITRESSSGRPLICVHCRIVHYINTATNNQRSPHLCWCKQLSPRALPAQRTRVYPTGNREHTIKLKPQWLGLLQFRIKLLQPSKRKSETRVLFF